MHCSKTALLFDHLVGACEQRSGHIEDARGLAAQPILA
jgi:hypothetical protein